MSRKLIESSLRLETDILSNYSKTRAEHTYDLFGESKKRADQDNQPHVREQSDIPYALLVYLEGFDISENKVKVTRCINKIGQFKTYVYLFDKRCLVEELRKENWATVSAEISHIANDYVSDAIRKHLPKIHDNCSSYHLYISSKDFEATVQEYDLKEMIFDARSRHSKRSIEDNRVLEANMIDLAKRKKPLLPDQSGIRSYTQLIYKHLVLKTLKSKRSYELSEVMAENLNLVPLKTRDDTKYTLAKQKKASLYNSIMRINKILEKEYSIKSFIERGNKGWMINLMYWEFIPLLEASLKRQYLK